MPLTRGIIIADTKFEFGQDDAGKLYLIDEALTPDSSRFWPADQYRVGTNPPSFDKQFVRDWLEAQKWNKQPPAPAIACRRIAQDRREIRRSATDSLDLPRNHARTAKDAKTQRVTQGRNSRRFTWRLPLRLCLVCGSEGS